MYSFFGAGLIPSYCVQRSSAIAPGRIVTDLTAPVKTMHAMHDEIMLRTSAGHWGQTKDIAGTAIFVAFKPSDFVTGETIRVDGGYAIH